MHDLYLSKSSSHNLAMFWIKSFHKKWTILLLDIYNFQRIEIFISDWNKFIWSDLSNTRHVLQNSTRHANSGILQCMTISVLRICHNRSCGLQNVSYSRLDFNNDPSNPPENNLWKCWSVFLLSLPLSNKKSLQSAGS